jgi:two-component system cell cycle sensor histidine kinase/response regulator CckA
MSSPPAYRNGWRIIVTDDSPDKLYALTKTLREAGHCVFAAYDGEAALELVTLLPNVNLLVTNTRLGIVDGATLMRATRRLRPDLPILHVSHDPPQPDITPPGVPTLSEPFTPNELLMVVGSLLA